MRVELRFGAMILVSCIAAAHAADASASSEPGAETSRAEALGAGPPSTGPVSDPPSDPLSKKTVKAEKESFHYRWHLSSFLGRIAGLFFPSNGEGVLSFSHNREGHLISELLITSEKSEEGEFWRYGSEMDPEQHRTLRAWSSYRFRGKEKEKEAPVTEEGVIDVASGIQRIRADPPTKPTDMRIWSDGRIYPVTVIPRGWEDREVGEETVSTRHFEIKGREVPGERLWEGSLELWLAEDEGSTPVRILIRRTGIGVNLELQPGSEGAKGEIKG